MYTIEDSQYYTHFNTYAQLVNYLVAHNYSPWWDSNITLNSIFADVATNPNDKKHLAPNEYAPRQTLIYDDQNRNIYNHELIYAVSHTPYSRQTYLEWLDQPKRYYLGYRIVSRLPKYRQEPVPGTGRRRKRGHAYRRNHYMRDRRLAAREDDSKLVRPSRRADNIPSSWDLEKTRTDHHDHGWKSQGKYRHQWERKLSTSFPLVDEERNQDGSTWFSNL